MFATGLICFLAGGVCAALYVNHYAGCREVEAFNRGHANGFDDAVQQQREKDSERAQKAAQTRRSKANAS